MFLRRFFLFLAAAATPTVLSAQGPDYAHIPTLNSEYELDRFMNDLPWDWRDRFRSTATGFQATAGSLNIRHLYLEETLKVRFPLSEGRWWFRVRHRQLRGFERDETATELEFEYSPFERWYFSFLGEPAFHKSDADAGVAARWGPEEGRSIRLAYLWPDFDTNYAFHNKSTGEGFERFYRRLPQEARGRAVWTTAAWSVFAEGTFRRPWELQYQDLTVAANRYISRGSHGEAVFDLRFRPGEWTWALEGETWRMEESIDFEPAVPASNRSLVQERTAARLSVERSFGENWRARAGGMGVVSRGVLRHPLQSTLDQRFHMRDRIAFVRGNRRLSGRTWLEAGYTFDRQWIKEQGPGGGPPGFKHQSQNRGRLGLEWNAENGASLRLLSALELDTNQAERFVSFDGWTVQFQTTF